MLFRSHPLRLTDFLRTFLELFADQISKFTFESSSVVTTAYAVKFLQESLFRREYDISRGTIQNFSDKAKAIGVNGVVAKAAAESDNAPELGRSIVMSFFAEGRLAAILECALFRIMILSPRDVETWQSDPEEWLEEEDIGDKGNFSDWASGMSAEGLRYEAQELINALVALDKDAVAQSLTLLHERISKDEASLLKLEAVYRAMGAIIEDTPEIFNTNNLFNSTLFPLLSVKKTDQVYQNVHYRIVMARAAWLVGRIGESLDGTERTLLYDALVPLLWLPDLVVAFNGVRALRFMIEYMTSGFDQWSSCLEPCVGGVVDVARRLTSLSWKGELLQFLEIAIEKATLEGGVRCTNVISTTLAPLWANGAQVPGTSVAESELMILRTHIVGLLTVMFRKIGAYATRSERLMSIVLPILYFGLDIKKDGGGFYMLEESLELWEALIIASNSYTEQIDGLFPGIREIMERDFDNLKIVARIIEGYAMLGQVFMMERHGGLLVEVLEKPIGQIRDRGMFSLCDVMETSFRCFKEGACRLLMKISFLLFTRLMENLDSPVICAAYSQVLLRAAIYDWESFNQHIIGGNGQLLASFLRKCIGLVDHMYRSKRRKFAAIALCELVTRNASEPAVVELVPDVLNIVVQSLAEEVDVPSRSQKRADYNNYVYRVGEDGHEKEKRMARDDEGEPIFPGLLRRQRLDQLDMFNTVSVGQVADEMVKRMRSLGGEQVQAVLSRVDNRIFNQLNLFYARERERSS